MLLVKSPTLASLTVLYSRQQLDEFLFALGLVLTRLGFGELRDVHGAELGPAHRAKLRFLVEVVGKIFVVHRFCGWRIE